MYPDEKYRAFLLGMADAETEAGVEEGILDGRIDPGYLRQIEDELIDDLVFGRLSTPEERIFLTEFLSTPERIRKLEFARALQHYAIRPAREAGLRGAFLKLRRFGTITWALPLAGALGCAVLVATWLGERNLSLRHELAQATQLNDEHQRVISSMLEEQARRTSQPPASIPTTESKPGPVSSLDRTAAQPSIRLSPVNRGLAKVSVLHLDPLATTVSILLELPFDLRGTLREELLNSEGEIIWSQRFSRTSGISNHGSITIVLPAGLLATGEYRLRTETGLSPEEPGDTATYLFRIRKH